MPTTSLWSLLSVLVVRAIAAQELPPPQDVAQATGAPIDHTVQRPAGFLADRFQPLVLLLGDVTPDPAVDRERALALARAFAARGMVVAVPVGLVLQPPVVNADGVVNVLEHAGLKQLPALLRRQFRIAGGGMHLVALGRAGTLAQRLAEAEPWQFRSLTLVDGEGLAPAVPMAMWARPCTVFGGAPPLPWPPGSQQPAAAPRGVIDLRPAIPAEQMPAALAEHLAALSAVRAPAAAATAAALDDFHDAAANGDAERYFARFPDDAVFLGTDATERWVGAEFRAFAMPYFRRGSAWTFVPVVRHVDIGSGGRGDVAWFHEQLDSAAYGECRGTGVLERRDGRWVVRMYDLTIPVPNDLAKGLVQRIRAFAMGREATATVVLVRHCEKEAGDDPDLTAAGRARAERLAAMLAEVPITAVFTSEFRRTMATAAPTCAAKGLTARAVPAGNGKALAQSIRDLGPGGTAFVAAHSNTIGPLLLDLGIAEPVVIADDDYGQLFVVTRSAEGARLLRLHY